MIKATTGILAKSSQPLLLDSISLTSLLGAWSFRKLKNDYTGNAVQTRTSFNDSLLDIGFIGSGDFDTTALANHVGSNSGFLRIWYDQHSTTNDVIQNTNSQQPRIRNLGVNDEINTNRIGARGVISSNNRLVRTLSTNITNNTFTVFAAINYVNDGAYRRLMSFMNISDSDYASNSGFVLLSSVNGNLELWRNGVNSGINIVTNTKAIVCIEWNGSVGQLTVNNTLFSPTINNSANFNMNTFVINGSFDGVNDSTSTSNIAEVIVYNRVLTSLEKNTIQQNMGAYYGITVA